MTRFATERPYADPEAAARQLVQLAASIEPVQDGRIHIEKINGLFLYTLKGSGSEFGAGIKYAVQRLARAARKRHLCTLACTEQESPELGTSASAAELVMRWLFPEPAERPRPILSSPLGAGAVSQLAS